MFGKQSRSCVLLVLLGAALESPLSLAQEQIGGQDSPPPISNDISDVPAAEAGSPSAAAQPPIPDAIAVDTAEPASGEPLIRERSKNRLIEEVVVTAQKREENSQDVPIAISAVSAEKLEALGIETTYDLAKITPGLSFTYTYGYTVVYLRGVGTDAFLPSADPSIASYIDGINIPSGQGKNDSLGPVKRVEVLKGPQGTLFGRNATGGAINIITADPPKSFEGNAKAEVGVYDTPSLEKDPIKRSYSAYIGTPITDWLGVTAGYYQDLPIQLVDNILDTGERGPFRKDYSRGGRVKLKGELENFDMTVIGSRVKQFNGPGFNYENVRPAPILAGDVPNTPADRVYSNNFQGGVQTDTKLLAGILGWHPGPVDVKLTVSKAQNDVPIAADDYDQTSNNQVTFFTYSQFNEQKTYELQFTSNHETWLSDNFTWAAGLYRLEGEGGFHRLFFTVGSGFVTNVAPGGNALARIPGINSVLNADTGNATLEGAAVLVTRANSGYFQGTWSFNDQWNATLGARYQHEFRTIKDSYLDLVENTPAAPLPDSYYEGDDRSRNIRVFTFSVPGQTANTLSPRAALQWRPNENIQFYTSLSRAFKSPTYNTINFFSSPDAVKKETATSGELGFKSDLLDKTLRFNAAIFKTRIDNPLTAIVSLTSGGVVKFYNAKQADIRGAEFDTQWQPLPDVDPGLAVNASASYVHGRYTSFKNGSGFDDTTGLYFGDDNLTGPNARDFSGNRIVRTPTVSGSLTVSQLFVMDNSDIETAVDVFYSSGFNTTPQNSPLYEQPAYQLWNARVTYRFDPWHVGVTAFVNNFTNTQYVSTLLQNDFGKQESLAEPRLFGLRLSWDFGKLF